MLWPIRRMLADAGEYRRTGGIHCAALSDGETILCLYENGEKDQYEKMTLARFTLEWLTEGKDHLKK